MKSIAKFVKQVFASILGTAIFTTCFLLLAFGAIRYVVKEKILHPKKEIVKANSILEIELEGHIEQYIMEKPSNRKQISLREMEALLEEAAYDNRITGIYVKLGSISGGMDKLNSLRRLFAKFKEKSGKPLFIYSEYYSDSKLAFSSVADKRIVHPSGIVLLKGISSKSVYYKRLLDKFDVEFILYQSGDHKNRSNPYCNDKMDDFDKKQLKEIYTTIHNIALEKISGMSGKSKEELVTIINENPLLTPEEALENNLVTDIGYIHNMGAHFTQYFQEKIQNLPDDTSFQEKGETTPEGPGKEVVSIKLKLNRILYPEYRRDIIRKYKKIVYTKKGDAVGFIYLRGTIVSEKSSKDTSTINTAWVMPILKEYKENEDIKSIVLIMTTPGGDSIPTMTISDFIESIQGETKKPVLCLASGYIFSGGQWIGSSCTKIIACSESTLFGSIGVWFSGLNLKGTVENHLYMNIDGVKTHENADLFGDVLHPHTEKEKEMYLKSVKYCHEQFDRHIQRTRNMEDDELKEVSGGMIFAAKRALELGLIDEIIPEDVTDQIGYVVRRALEEAGIDPDEIDDVRRVYPESTFSLRRFLVYFVNGSPIYIKKLKQLKDKANKNMALSHINPDGEEDENTEEKLLSN